MVQREVPKHLESRPRLVPSHRLVEATLFVLRSSRKRPDDRRKLLDSYRQGLRVVLSDERLKQTDLTSEEVESVADGLLIDEKIGDYFGRMIYGSACALDRLPLTEDDDLLALMTKGTLRPRDVLEWKDIVDGEGPSLDRARVRSAGRCATRSCRTSRSRTSRRSSSSRRGCSTRS
jgi:hypothetical protein